MEVKARHTLGIALGRLGDPRVIDDLRDLSAYVECAKCKVQAIVPCRAACSSAE